MKNHYSLTVLLCTICITAFSQSNNYPMETVGTPSSVCFVNNYSGWTNNGVLTFSGNAEVQNTNSSNNLSASGGGNVFFNNVAGTFLQIDGFNPSTAPASMDITFDMYGYNAANLSELVLEYSTDGITYTPLTYKRLFRNYFPPTPWDVMESDPLPGSINISNLKIRFRQTSTTQQFRIDDIEANFYSTLPVKLLSFSASKIKTDVQINWTASSTDEHEYFVLERSSDGRHFTAITSVPVKGNGEFAYNYTDRPVSEKTFYRMKLVDAGGKSTYSQIIFVQFSNTRGDLLQNIYPNPARQVLNTQLLSNRQENAVLTVTDLSGRTVISRNFPLSPGMNNCALNVEKLNSGLYILKIMSGNVTETRSVVIQ